MSPAAPGTAGDDARSRFKDRVREWREQAIFQAVGELLVEEGCLSLTMDGVARRVGVAKGSLYLHAPTRNALVSQVLDRWAEDVPTPASSDPSGPLTAVCEALFSGVQHRDSARSPALPCCLHTSPCPHGWTARWRRVAEAYGLEPTPEIELIGQAVQALAATESVRSLVAEGRLADAGAIVTRFAAGYLAGAPAKG